ncbi:hypothetical protein FQN52_007600 [Onygenales sp. PD_12]|nr:hypothetical protein FQN52_007600 [Onygenales sp. PD_12]
MATQTCHGTCLCEAVRFAVEGQAEKVFMCYCKDCIKNGGAPYQIVIYLTAPYTQHTPANPIITQMGKFNEEQVKLQSGDELVGTWVVKKTTSGIEKHKLFCNRCGCTLWTIPMGHKGEKFIVRTALLEDGLGIFKPEAEFFASLRPSYLEAPKGVKSFDTMPGR